MLDEEIRSKYKSWLENIKDAALLSELKAMNEQEIEEVFYSDLSFGTGGLRGVMGVGSNRMNIYTVAKATQGLAEYIKNKYPENERTAAISYDSRLLSDVFAEKTAEILAANGIHVYLYRELMPTPCLSFAVRELNCAVGVMITASHNPAKYNGYKVYGHDGCQITNEAASLILKEINRTDIFRDVKTSGFEEEMKAGRIEYISDEVTDKFIECVEQQTVAGSQNIDRNVTIVFSPLNGTGLKPVLQVLNKTGYTNIVIVKEQEKPDGNFPTCPYPNPEIAEAMQLGIEYCRKNNADILIATDPDCDRCGIAVKKDDDYVLLSANETGVLLLDYICARLTEANRMPDRPVFIKTIVTTDLSEKIASSYGVETINVLTGFKYIGETIGKLESKGEADRYIFGFEESYGYLSGTYVRDKDAVNAAYIICEMFAYYKTRGISLTDKLDAIYRKYGYSLNTLHSYTLEGKAGLEKIKRIMAAIRENVQIFKDVRIDRSLDYQSGLDGLPKSNVMKLYFENGSVVIRPSGTEPKIKIYFSVQAESKEMARQAEEKLSKEIDEYVQLF